MKGLIIQGIGGFYTVAAEDGARYVCKARGVFRKRGIKPLVGDHVEFLPGEAVEGGEDGWIESVAERKNECARPPVANVDTLVIVIACVPIPDLGLMDRLLVSAARAGIECLLCVNKIDMEDAVRDTVREEYGRWYTVLSLSAARGDGMDALRAAIAGRVSAFAGQSGVGKSSILNALLPQWELETGAVSVRSERGRHTTRKAELFSLPGGGYVADTPGFSLLELDLFDPEELRFSYPELASIEGQCRFLGCQHRREPGCAASGVMAAGRLARYHALYAELEQRWKRKYQ